MIPVSAKKFSGPEKRTRGLLFYFLLAVSLVAFIMALTSLISIFGTGLALLME